MSRWIPYEPSLKFLKTYVDTFHIYTLKNPFTRDIFYVGKTKKGLAGRLNGHIYDHSIANKRKRDHVKEIIFKGSKPIIESIEIIEGLCKADAAWAQEREYHWIRHYKTLGCNLMNIFGMDDTDCPEYRRYINLVNAGNPDLEYYLCGYTREGHTVYDQKRMAKDGFSLEQTPPADDLYQQIAGRENQYQEFISGLRQEFRGNWPPPWINSDLLKYVLPMPDWSPEFSAQIPEDEFLLDLELEDCDLEIDDWGEEDDFDEVDY